DDPEDRGVDEPIHRGGSASAGRDASHRRTLRRRAGCAAAMAGSPISQRMNSGARTRVIVASSLTRTWRDGPAVSLNGSPTVSPTTAAAWAGVFLPIGLPCSSSKWPDSMYFLALSQAPPPLLRTVASITPAIVPTMS